MARVLYISPFGKKNEPFSGRVFDFDQVFSLLKPAIEKMVPDVELIRADYEAGSIIDPESLVESVILVVCDITTHNPNVLYELGFARGRGKPSIVVTARSGPIPFDLNRVRVIAYDPEALSNEYVGRLSESIRRAIEDPKSFTIEETAKARGKKVFVSYSHKDKEYLDRMLVHLKPLENAGLIDAWVDTRLKTGARWKDEIAATLQAASFAILLVSADFLASDFIVKNELPPILAKAEGGGTRIIPVIVKPCRFARDPNLSKFQSHNSPERPLSSLTDSEREQVFDSLAASLEQTMTRLT